MSASYTNPYSLPDFGKPTAVPIFLAVEVPFSQDWYFNFQYQIWKIWNAFDDTIAGQANFRLTYNRPDGPFGNYGVVRVVARNLNPMHGQLGLTPQGLWLTVPNTNMTERAAFVSVTGADPLADAQTAAHEFGHAVGLQHSPLPDNVMQPGGAATYTVVTPDQLTQRVNCFNWWGSGLIK